jgi:hypothetical protein
MCRFTLTALAICTAALLAGCKGESSPETDAKVKRAKEDIKRAASTTAEAAAAKRDEYAKEMHKQLTALDVKIADLQDQVSNAAGETKKKLERKLEETKSRHSDAARKLEELKAASADRWEKLKDGMGKAYEDLKKVIE